MHQKVAFPDQPARAIRCQAKRRNQIVDVGMVTQVARPGLQDAQHANLPTQKAWVLGELLQRRSRCMKEQGIDRLRLVSSECAELRWQREGDQKVGNWQ